MMAQACGIAPVKEPQMVSHHQAAHGEEFLGWKARIGWVGSGVSLTLDSLDRWSKKLKLIWHFWENYPLADTFFSAVRIFGLSCRIRISQHPSVLLSFSLVTDRSLSSGQRFVWVYHFPNLIASSGVALRSRKTMFGLASKGHSAQSQKL